MTAAKKATASTAGRPLEEIAGLDRLVHEPARLAILTALSACRSADFLYLARASGLTHGNLSSHLARLEDAGFVTVSKEFSGRLPLTTVTITARGRERVDAHWRRLEQLRRRSMRFVSETATPH